MANGNGEGARVLVIDDDPAHAEVVAEALERVGHECVTAGSGREGVRLLERDEFDVVLTDLRMADLDGLAVVRRAKEVAPDAQVLVATGFADVATAVQAIQQGAAHYLVKSPDYLKELRAVVAKAAEQSRLVRTNKELRRQLDEKFGFEGVVGNGQRMHAVLTALRAFAPKRVTVLVLGENGTGKELVARALHFNSPRKLKPFVALNCTALNENLLDDELFGHEKGAFTGAEAVRKGRFEYANGGTLFLDEVGDMPLPLQAKLLRVLENGEITRIGSNDPIKVDVRVISATNRNLEQAIAEGKFRQDLYYRLRVGTVRLPPLRERRDDLPLLMSHFLKEFNGKHGTNVQSIGDSVRRAFAAYDFPGNVRELRNLIESMVVSDTDGVLGLDDLPEGVIPGAGGGTDRPAGADALVGRPLAEVERYYTERALEMSGGNREEAARMLDISERTLYRKIQEWKKAEEVLTTETQRAQRKHREEDE